MAAPARLSVIAPWRIWLFVTVMAGLLFLGAAVALRSVSSSENQRLAELQLDTIARSRLPDIERGDLRSLVDGLGSESSKLFISVADGTSSFEIGLRSETPHCARRSVDLTVANERQLRRQASIELCRPFTSPFPIVALIGTLFALISGSAMLIAVRLEKGVTRSLVSLFSSHGLEACESEGLAGLLVKSQSLSQAVADARRAEIEFERAKALGEIAEQVAHDIRSPLAALKMSMQDPCSSIPRREVALSAVDRISAIADDLLMRRRQSPGGFDGDFGRREGP